MNFIIKSLQEFNSLPEEIRKRIGGIESLANIKVLEEKYQVELSFLVILISIGTLSIEDIEDYLMKKFNFSEEDASELKFDLLNHVFSSLLTDLDELGVDLDKLSTSIRSLEDDFIDVLDEEELEDQELISVQGLFTDDALLRILEKNLLEQLTSKQGYSKVDESIMMQITFNADFQVMAQKSILANQEKIGKEQINLGNKRVSPTASNWIKDFIKNIGSDIFDGFKLMQYINSSQNLKTLNTQEKDILHRVLLIYRRIYFFPEDYEPQAKIDDILHEKEEASISTSPDMFQEKSGAPKTKRAKELEPTRVTTTKQKPISTTTQTRIKKTLDKTKDQKAKTDKKLLELEAMLKQYPNNSLEYKTIQQEIKRYLNNKKK